MSFDTLAPHYRWMEGVLAGRKLQICRTAFLSAIEAPQRALLLGEGNGRFLVEFAKRFPAADVVCLDASESMLIHAKRAMMKGGFSVAQVKFVHADLFEWKAPSEKFDLIVTNFFLDCFDEERLRHAVQKISDSAAPRASLLLADFCEPPRGWRKWRARWILASMYLFFRFATKLPAKKLIVPDALLRQYRFELVDQKKFDWGLLRADWWRSA
jgi:ubiquinone/menaquinone biosynthesis C-methylase UbiE